MRSTRCVTLGLALLLALTLVVPSAMRAGEPGQAPAIEPCGELDGDAGDASEDGVEGAGRLPWVATPGRPAGPRRFAARLARPIGRSVAGPRAPPIAGEPSGAEVGRAVLRARPRAA